MAIESEKLGIPETSYSAQVKMPAAEFQRIIQSMATLGDTGTFKWQHNNLHFLF